MPGLQRFRPLPHPSDHPDSLHYHGLAPRRPGGPPMSTDPDTILLETEEHMEKALDHLKNELRGVRTGRASPAMVEYLKVDYYGSMTDLKALAAISVPEPTQLLIKPFDQGAMPGIKQAIEKSG